MKKGGNLAVVHSNLMDDAITDTDGEDGGSDETLQVTIDVAENGYVVTKTSGDDVKVKVFLFDGGGDASSKEMIRTIIDDLGLTMKVRVEK